MLVHGNLLPENTLSRAMLMVASNTIDRSAYELVTARAVQIICTAERERFLSKIVQFSTGDISCVNMKVTHIGDVLLRSNTTKPLIFASPTS